MITTKQDINSRLDELFGDHEFLRDWMSPLVAIIHSLHDCYEAFADQTTPPMDVYIGERPGLEVVLHDVQGTKDRLEIELPLLRSIGMLVAYSAHLCYASENHVYRRKNATLQTVQDELRLFLERNTEHIVLHKRNWRRSS